MKTITTLGISIVLAALGGGAGYLLGQMFEAVLGDLAEKFGLIMLAVFMLIMTGVVIMHKRLQQREAALLAKKLARDKEKEKEKAPGEAA